MNFTAVVEKARHLVTRGARGEEKPEESTLRETPDAHGPASRSSSSSQGCPSEGCSISDCGSKGDDVIYGRVCTTAREEPPQMLSSDSSRKSVFLFGPDAVEAIIVKQTAYNILCSIGRDKDYLYHMVP